MGISEQNPAGVLKWTRYVSIHLGKPRFMVNISGDSIRKVKRHEIYSWAFFIMFWSRSSLTWNTWVLQVQIIIYFLYYSKNIVKESNTHGVSGRKYQILVYIDLFVIENIFLYCENLSNKFCVYNLLLYQAQILLQRISND